MQKCNNKIKGGRSMANEDLKRYAREKRVKLWEIAERFGCNDGNFSRKLRTEFTPEIKENTFKLIDEIATHRDRG